MKRETKFALLCATIISITFTSCVVQQKLSMSYQLQEGMTKSEVVSIMGSPIKSDFYKNVEEWHYCRTGWSADEFISLFFYEGKLIAKKNYTVTIADTNGVGGSCDKFIKRGNYREPDIVLEIRGRYF
jgi:outer membrane protein assembly factor BamE (lipoprotein component of BamABCDE complex)